MKIAVFFIVTWASLLVCNAGTFDPDTLDNWQIYNGEILILAGNQSGKFPITKISLQNFKDLRIKYNSDNGGGPAHCLISILIPADKLIGVSKEFTKEQDGSYIIPLRDLKTIPIDLSNIHRSSVKIFFNGKRDFLGTCIGLIEFE